MLKYCVVQRNCEMARNESNCIYNKTHNLPIFDKRGVAEERNLHIQITDFCDSVQIKVKDVDEFSFNFTENINLNDFEFLRSNQNLDINFNEFKTDLIEMLQQSNKMQEMYLKCELAENHVTLIFYGKSKIKNIIYLTLDLRATNQRDIFNEMNNNLQKMQDCNERLKRQLVNNQNMLSEKEMQIKNLILVEKQLKFQFFNNLKQLDSVFNAKIKEVEALIISKIVRTNERFLKLLCDVEAMKKESFIKNNSTQKLAKSVETLRLETIQSECQIRDLKKENSALHSLKHSQEKTIFDLTKRLQEKDHVNLELKKHNEELRQDLEKSSIVIVQKNATHDELAKDLLQANQMLVNFHKLYDSTLSKTDELQKGISDREKHIGEQRMRLNDLVREFEEYKAYFNSDLELKYKHELMLANNKIEELEQSIRKANKINTLLTDKVNGKMFH